VNVIDAQNLEATPAGAERPLSAPTRCREAFIHGDDTTRRSDATNPGIRVVPRPRRRCVEPDAPAWYGFRWFCGRAIASGHAVWFRTEVIAGTVGDLASSIDRDPGGSRSAAVPASGSGWHSQVISYRRR